MLSARSTVIMSSGDARLASLYESHSTMAIRLAYLLTGDHERARDICQDAFVRVAARLGHLRSEDAFASYLRRTIVNLSNSHFRRLRIEIAHQRREAARKPSIVYPPDTETQDEISTLVRALPPRQRTAVVLRYYLDLTTAEISDVMGVSVDAVNGLLRRGLRQIESEIEEGDDRSLRVRARRGP